MTGGISMGGGGRIYPKYTESYVRVVEMVEIGGGSRPGSGGDRRSEAALSTHPWDLWQLISGDPANRFSWKLSHRTRRKNARVMR